MKKPAPSAKGRNDNRPNGKAWKKSHGNNPPVEQSQADSQMNRIKKSNQKGN